jgi:DNA mismatch repair protein MutL
MARIKHLDEDTINKIAAGEVIERPASAVKELVENSIDARARRIIVEVNDGGSSLIRVTDDGCGIEPDDLPLAFMKHATSKISNARDLESIKTLGFRGEALASIASVSRCVEVRTRIPGSLSGTYMRMEAGKVAEIKGVGCAVGTTITVWDLFYNVPARRKHLKGRGAELVHVTNTITEMAIINYTIAFELLSGRRTIFKSARASCWDDVLLRIFGLKTFNSMAPLQAEGRGWRLTGTAGDPFSARSSSDRIFIFVNGRAVSSRALAGALRDAYRNIIPQAKSPVAVLSLVVEPELVDVNVHPAKREIRLLREEEICSALSQAVAGALAARAQGSQAAPERSPHVSLHPSRAMIAQGSEQVTLPLQLGLDEKSGLEERAAEMRRPRVKILGQILDLYIVAEGEQCLMLIDQHAAAERIRFERLQERYINRKIRQELAVPITIDLSPSERILMESWNEKLSEIGFEIAPFGGDTISVRSVPALGKWLESAEAIHDILSDLFAVGKVGQGSINRDEILRLLACKGSIKSGKELGMAEMQRLLEELYECQNPLTCPHGRPVAVTIDQNQLERLFARR